MKPELSRREWLKLSTAGVVGFSLSGWLESLAADAASHPQRRRSCILLWMSGGPSQMDTFDLKPGNENGGPYKEIATSVPGIRISEHLPRVAQQMKDMVLIRSMSTREADHERATYAMRTGQTPGGPIQYPSLGALLSKELGSDESPLPNFVSVAPTRFIGAGSFGSGFLGPQYAPLIVGEGGGFSPDQTSQEIYERALKVPDLDRPKEISLNQANARVNLLEDLDREFLTSRPAAPSLSHRSAYERAVRMMRSAASRAFNVGEEPPRLRDAYGRNLFGQGCLLARRLVERGVPFVEVTLSNPNGMAGGFGWDTHAGNFEAIRQLSQVLDPAWGTLMTDLRERGLLESTLVVWMGEFGRTPKINSSQGRDHWASSWSTVLGGGGLRGGQVVGRTSADGTAIEDRPVSVQDFLATVCLALGIDYKKQNMSPIGRPIRIVDLAAKPIKEIVA